VWTLQHAADVPPVAAASLEEPLVARTEGGARTEVSRALRAFFGLPSPRDEAPSP
jgi:hypothetical protein